jgi:capsular exopolysaccharide synthesis family protein
MEVVQRRLNMEVSKAIASIKNEYESGLRRESLLRAAFEQQKTKAMEVQQRAIQYNILKREADTNKELYKTLLQRMKEVGVSATLNPSNIKVIDQAEVPTAPYKPNRQRNLVMALAVGLFLGIGLALFFEYFESTIKTPSDVEQIIRLPSFGIVPEISYKKRRGLDKGKAYPIELITFRHPRSMLSEAYRGIRASILLSFSERPPKTIVISSPSPAEGKTTTLVNTAIALSQIGAQVLIIDADMRKPKVHQIFDQGNGMGLSTFLSGNVKLGSVVKKTNIPNLSHISAGPVPPNPSELLGSKLFKEMLKSLAENFDQIIIDSPPVLGFTDSIVLSSSVDGVILVVLGGKTQKEALQQAKETLLQVNAKILGVVINRVNIQRYEYKDYYYRHQYYQSYYGKEGKKELPFHKDRKNA